jgi:hypothetical protein
MEQFALSRGTCQRAPASIKKNASPFLKEEEHFNLPEMRIRALAAPRGDLLKPDAAARKPRSFSAAPRPVDMTTVAEWHECG